MFLELRRVLLRAACAAFGPKLELQVISGAQARSTRSWSVVMIHFR